MYTLKKSLGQHFLKDENICRQIVDSLQAYPFSQLLEVGPGGGALTKYLIKLPEVDLRCVELDDEKVTWLLKTYPALEGKIIHKSVLDIDPPFEGPFTVVGNFPYNISTEILFKVLAWKDQIQTMVGMFQKEVAQRVAAKEGSKVYGVTSVLMQAHFQVDYLFEVDEEAFNPPPKVKSAVIRMKPLEQPVPTRSDKHLALLVKTAFQQRRKTLRNAVKSLFDPEKLQDDIFNKRAEQLSVADFAALTYTMR
ncbi:ribosomal RNA small subunit methyltransferase A [Pseudoflavitalea sp. G-6-1-2]|uniref:16S rRNA (adenine(1518)-N(6)/adenine(1519)-N(6))- dimethyltransferase RsmA n=1 Tax=Pseudoflavitalea sp. G-6-1-2 TaxID=2728841 RepID=UPI00146A9D9C|nr:16S rRNA (adenine(1518)-N(6)/adenine(1519)-N(6))-dimethyltransferase RsmA [Pseudoflavitalea sp. G-6-1-2]NML20515.1 ribosomal RNA small subunit methyltransferase A [Pseudoflavitalea sp. G-6-1-2]